LYLHSGAIKCNYKPFSLHIFTVTDFPHLKRQHMMYPYSNFTCLIQGFIHYHHHQANAYVNIPWDHSSDNTS